MSTILQANNIKKVYHSAAGDVCAVKDVSLNFGKGLFYALIGKSGSGKSTLLHVLGGLDRPTEGTVLIDGTDLFSYSDEKMAIFRRRHMGFVFQQFNLLDEYNVYNNICMPLKLDGKSVDKTYFDEIVNMLGINKLIKKYPSELSGGEQQRAAIARAMISKPQLIFADEPTGNLDKKTSEETMNLLLDCARKMGQTLIVVTHDLDIAKKADIVIQLEDGNIV
ncbi:MAG: ABC transporter ATP-binding protein [Lachnobacterium sp.]|nr:ABC transporter ATP-binding protein [Lachnobacterium sp.]